jgi:hypothetical protein
LHHGRAFALPGAIAAGAVAYATHRALDAHAAGAFGSPLDAVVRRPRCAPPLLAS